MRSTHKKYGKDPKGQPLLFLAPCTIHPFVKITAQQHIECASFGQHPTVACHAHALRGRHDPCVLHVPESTIARTKLLFLFCILGSTCNSCAMVPCCFSQTFLNTAGPTAYIKGLKQKARKKSPPQNPETTATKTLLFWLKLKSRPSYGCGLMRKTWHSCRAYFNQFIHLPVQVIYPKNKPFQHILYLSLCTLVLICCLAFWLEKTDLGKPHSNQVERRQDHCVNSNTTKMLPTKYAASRIAYSPTDFLLP